jgi:MFS family permease
MRAPVLLFALATAVIVQCLYVAQPLVGAIAASQGLSPAVVSLVSTLAMLGYALGLFLLVPLSGLMESRRLVLFTLAVNGLALLAALASGMRRDEKAASRPPRPCPGTAPR